MKEQTCIQTANSSKNLGLVEIILLGLLTVLSDTRERECKILSLCSDTSSYTEIRKEDFVGLC